MLIFVTIVVLALTASLLMFMWPAMLVMIVRLNIRQTHGLREERMKLGDVEWSFLRGGKGGAIVLLPGFGSHKYQWGNALYQLSSEGETIFLDLPGFGDSAIEEGVDLSPGAQADRVIALLDALGTKAVTLIGASLGGYIAGLISLSRPAIVERLVLIDPAGVSGSRLRPVLAQFIDTGKHPFSYSTVAKMNELFYLLFENVPPMPSFLKAYLARKNLKNIPIRERALVSLRRFGVFGLDGRLAQLPNNTLVVWGKMDRLLDVTAVERIESEAPHVKIAVIDGCGHLPYMDAPEHTMRAIRSFLLPRLPI